ncbi:DnaJ sub C member 7 [Puccinia graminis f. sp. tritici]|uniref:DnaJ sub C member 7 n=1 Tax=Puccinia graminis f. sp. tritici TaxID=56615 RepID=A0A5B0PGS5_PUCGR|nr:DnaJ sub C member 7 [Puccinia graminis f. sp. tritici]
MPDIPKPIPNPEPVRGLTGFFRICGVRVGTLQRPLFRGSFLPKHENKICSSLKYHPRRFNPGDRFIEIHFKKLADAYETLIDPQKRLEYDKKLNLKDINRLNKPKNPDSSRLFDAHEQYERHRRHSTSLVAAPTRPASAAAGGPSQYHRQLEKNPALSRTHPIPTRSSTQSSSRLPTQADQPMRARRSSISGLAPIPSNLNQSPSVAHRLLNRQTQASSTTPLIQPKPFNPSNSSFQPPIRAGSCGPTLQSSSSAAAAAAARLNNRSSPNSSRLEESLLSMRLNQFPKPSSSQNSHPSTSKETTRVDRQSIINELNQRARSNSISHSSKPLYSISNHHHHQAGSGSSSASSSTISPSSSLSSSFSPRQPPKFPHDPSSSSSAAPLSRKNFHQMIDPVVPFHPPHSLSAAAHNRSDYGHLNDVEYQPLIVNPPPHKRAPHPRMSSSSSSTSTPHNYAYNSGTPSSSGTNNNKHPYTQYNTQHRPRDHR